MKIFITLLNLLVVNISIGQISVKDTTFLFKDTVDGQPQYIFIDTNLSSKFYKNIAGFGFGEDENKSYESSLQHLKDRRQKLIRRKPLIHNTEWVELKQYKSKFYVYYPCDFYNYYAHSINDTTFIDWTGEGPIANKIVAAKLINQKTFAFNLTGQESVKRNLIIHITDTVKGIAVFERIDKGKQKKYYLMIAADKIKAVPIIVNYCPYQKQSELSFEKPDFEKLLSSK